MAPPSPGVPQIGEERGEGVLPAVRTHLLVHGDGMGEQTIKS
jgi:hypothetical protein